MNSKKIPNKTKQVVLTEKRVREIVQEEIILLFLT